MVAKGIISTFCCFALLVFIAKSVDAAECEVGPGQVYQSGEDFILGCSASCTCGGPFFSCKPLCPLEQCPPGSEAVYENREVAGTDCFCKRIKNCLQPSL
ncbi:hypothetical protein ABFA07_011238 [Porites harrisoni]